MRHFLLPIFIFYIGCAVALPSGSDSEIEEHRSSVGSDGPTYDWHSFAIPRNHEIEEVEPSDDENRQQGSHHHQHDDPYEFDIDAHRDEDRKAWEQLERNHQGSQTWANPFSQSGTESSWSGKVLHGINQLGSKFAELTTNFNDDETSEYVAGMGSGSPNHPWNRMDLFSLNHVPSSPDYGYYPRSSSDPNAESDSDTELTNPVQHLSPEKYVKKKY